MVWKLLLFGFIGYAVYRMFMNDRHRKSVATEKTKEQMVASGEMTKDPTCGAYIDIDSSISVKNGEVIHKFCSFECRDAFLKKIGKLTEKTDD